jgi:hypothetical protein
MQISLAMFATLNILFTQRQVIYVFFVAVDAQSTRAQLALFVVVIQA